MVYIYGGESEAEVYLAGNNKLWVFGCEVDLYENLIEEMF